MDIKKSLREKCSDFVQRRKKELLLFMDSNRQALDSETKSSAGDKHETGRAMLQLEMEKASQQLESLQHMQEVLNRIDPHQHHDQAHLGSLVETSAGKFFLSIGAGEMVLGDGGKYFCVSPSSPIGRQLLGKSKGETFDFRSREVVVLEVM